MHTPRPTKNDSYAFLISEGIKRGCEVVPEYRVFLPNLSKKKSIDLVWVKRRPGAAPYQDRESQKYWDLVATFEIEGCNVSIKKEFDRHLRHLPSLNPHFNGRPVFHSIVLYTAAFDRSPLLLRDIDALIGERRSAAERFGIHVFSVNEPLVMDLLPNDAHPSIERTLGP
jgi:hypothetical protein